MNYDKYRYIYPPRAENAVHPDTLSEDRYAGYIAQPKLNGDCTVIFTNGIETIVMDRNNKPFKKRIPMLDTLKTLFKGDQGKWMILVGEHMIKSKKNAQGVTWNNKFVIFDILAHDGVHLIGKTFQERVDLLDELYGTDRFIDPFLYATEISDVYRVRSFYDHYKFTELFKELIQIDMYEGIVLKRAASPLQNGISSTNNSSSQVKTRKPTKNYNF